VSIPDCALQVHRLIGRMLSNVARTNNVPGAGTTCGGNISTHNSECGEPHRMVQVTCVPPLHRCRPSLLVVQWPPCMFKSSKTNII